MEREKTGIPGMDELIQGGIPKGSISLVSGSPGTGKSIFSQQFLREGVKNQDQRCLYISFEEEPKNIIRQAEGFGWNLKELQATQKLKIIYNDITKRTLDENETYIDIIKGQIEKFDPDRLVIDSLTPLSNFPVSFEELSQYGLATDFDRFSPIGIQQDLLIRLQMHKLINAVRSEDCTSILISEIKKDSKWMSADHVTEFLSDNVIMLKYPGGNIKRTLKVEKMRGTDHYEDEAALDITEDGIQVEKIEEQFK